MQKVSIAKLEAYPDEPITLIGNEEMLKDFLIYLYNLAQNAADGMSKRGLNATAQEYREFSDKCSAQTDTEE